MNRIKWFDSVRAFGLLLVLGYHLFYIQLPGGFLGVDIFFTFSGFLITALIMEEIRKNGEFDLVRFYARRARRIMIPLFLSIVFTLPFALLISPDFTVGISKQVASALSFTSNWYNISIGSSYEAQLLPQLYMHTWSLSVLMQFYIAWGAICALFVALLKAIFKKNRAKTQKFLKILIIAVSAIIAFCSYFFMSRLYNMESDLNAIYFNSFARMFPFFIGSVAAAVWGMHPKQDKFLKKRFFSKHKKIITAALLSVIVASVAVIIFIFSQHEFNDKFIYRYGFLFTSILAVVLIYSTHGLHILTPWNKDEPKALKVTADLSYDMYLYHWPIHIVFSALIMNHVAASLSTLAVTLALSAVMVYVVEKEVNPESIIDAIRHKRIAIMIISALVICFAAAGGAVIARAPVITSIESDFAVSYIVGDVHDIESLGRGIVSANDSPVFYPGEFDPLQANLLPAPIKPSDPSAQSDPQSPAPESSPSSLTPPSSLPEPQPSPQPSPEPSLQPSQEPMPQPSPETSTSPASSPEPSPEQITSPLPEPTPDSSADESISIIFETPPDSGERLPGVAEGVTVIGDSVPLGARSTMMNRILNCSVDAEVNRTVGQGRSLLLDLQSRYALREYVVIALGTNANYDYADQFTRIIDALNPGYRLIFVTPFDGRANTNGKLTDETSDWIRGLPAQYDFITVADWNYTISSQVELLAGDKVHLGGTASMELYSDLVSAAISAASQKPPKGSVQE